MPFTPYNANKGGFTPYKPASAPAPSSSPSTVAPQNPLQSLAGVITDPIVRLADEAGQQGGKFIIQKGIEPFLSKNQKANTEAKLQKNLSNPTRVPGTGTNVRPLNDVTGEDVAGQVAGTVGAFSGNPTVGGSLLAAGQAMENHGGVTDVAINGVVGAIAGKVLDLGFKAVAPEIEKVITKYGQPAFDKLVAYIPDASKDAYKAIATKAQSVLDKSGVSNVVEKVQNAAKTVDEKVSGTVKAAGSKLGFSVEKPKTDAQKIQDMIMPKATAKETRLAESQGRLVRGKDPTLFKSGTGDTIMPSDTVIRATKTIQERIPNASSMNDTQLYSALGNEIKTTAKEIRPALQKTPISENTISQVRKDWTTLRAKQLERADTTQEKEMITSLQNKFEERLQNINSSKTSDITDRVRSGEITMQEYQEEMQNRIKKIESASMDDLWQSRIDYDASTPDNVKNANHLSSESLQQKKEIWLENRAILNDAIHSSESGLTGSTRKGFQNMSDMYNAQEGILTNAKVEKPQPSKIRQFLDSEAGKLTKGALGLGTIAEGAKKLITGGF